MSSEISVRSRLLGVWSLEAIRDRHPDGTIVDHPDFGANPAGLLLYTDSGHVSVNFMGRDRRPWALEDEPTVAERAMAAAGYGAYAGRFTVHEREGFVVHHVEVALIPNRIGHDLRRFFSFSGDRLTLRPPIFVRKGIAIERSLVWRREGGGS